MTMEKLPGNMGTSDGDFGQFLKQPFKPGSERSPLENEGYGDYKYKPKGAAGRYDPTWTKKGPKYKYPGYAGKPPKGKKPKPMYRNDPKGKWPGKLPGTGKRYPTKIPGGFQFSPFGLFDPRGWPGNQFWGTAPRHIKGAGYEFEGYPPPDYHWAVSCDPALGDGQLASRVDNGWLSPSGPYECATGQVYNTFHPGVYYGDDFTLPTMNGGGMPSVTLGRRYGTVVFRMQLIEHWGWAIPVAPGPVDVKWSPPKLGPTPGWKPPAPEWEPTPKHPPDPYSPPPRGGGGGPPVKGPKPPYIGPDGHKNLPPSDPGPNRKWKIPKNPWGDIYGILTELGDYMDCLEKAFYGKTHRQRTSGRYRPLQERMLQLAIDLWNKPDQMWWEGAVSCMVINGAQDAAIAKFGDLAKEITKSPYWVRPVGPGAGGWNLRINSGV